VRRLLQRPQHDAVAQRLLDQLVPPVARALDVEVEGDAVEADGDLAVDPERAAQVELARRGHLDLRRLDAGGGCDHLARHLRAGSERAEQQIARARRGAFASDAGVRLGCVGRAADVDGAGRSACGLAPARAERDAGLAGLGAVALLQWPLGFAEIHAPTLARVIRARKVGKRFGDKRVLRGVDLDVPAGAFAVVTGPNGSGKTTLLRMCAGLALPSEGELEVDAPRAAVGYLAHEPLVYRELTALENLDLYGRLYRVPERRERIGMLLERFGLWDVRHDRVVSYSRGMMQRLALCRVLLHEPELLVLDEPYTALDTAGAELLDAQLAELRGERTVLVSTHDPDRVAPLATQRLALA
jgi:heme exporter protein A